MPLQLLEDRDGLPEPLRALLADYPRELWAEDPGFGGLIKFWLERHVMFRRLLAAMQDSTQAHIDQSADAQTYARALSRYGSMFVGELHAHHNIEDTHYFPRIKHLDSRITSGFDILDRDHHTIDARLNGFATLANTVLQAASAKQIADTDLIALNTELSTLETFLNRHLTDEEELIVPVLLKYTPEGLV